MTARRQQGALLAPRRHLGRAARPARDCALLRVVLAAATAATLVAPARAAVNSYRFLHVTIDTPWHIFLFLLMGVFAPFILMVVLMWRNSGRKRDIARARAAQAASQTPQPPQA